MVGLDLAGLCDVGVVAQPVEKLRPVGLRVDGLELDPLHKLLSVGMCVRRNNVRQQHKLWPRKEEGGGGVLERR